MTQPAQPQQPVQGQPDPNQQQQQQQVVTDPTQQQQQQQPQETQAPYAAYLAELPESVRPLVEPQYKKWDADVTRRFQELHSEYEPWKSVIEFGDPEEVMGALQVALTLQNDPQRFLTAFNEAFPELVQQAFQQAPNTQTQQQSTTTQTTEQGLGDLDPNDPLVKQVMELKQLVESVAGGFNNLTQQQQQEDGQRQLDQLLTKMHADHGEFDDSFILGLMASGATPDQAIKRWNDITAQFQQQNGQQTTQPNAPTVLTPGGGLPANPIDPSNLNSRDTEALVAQILQQANQES